MTLKRQSKKKAGDKKPKETKYIVLVEYVPHIWMYGFSESIKRFSNLKETRNYIKEIEAQNIESIEIFEIASELKLKNKFDLVT